MERAAKLRAAGKTVRDIARALSQKGVIERVAETPNSADVPAAQ
jgi:hypothetical protein